MARIERINADQKIRVNPSDPRHPRSMLPLTEESS